MKKINLTIGIATVLVSIGFSSSQKIQAITYISANDCSNENLLPTARRVALNVTSRLFENFDTFVQYRFGLSVEKTFDNYLPESTLERNAVVRNALQIACQRKGTNIALMFDSLVTRAAQAKNLVIISLVTDGAEDPPSPKGTLERFTKALSLNPKVQLVLVAGLLTHEGKPYRMQFETRVASLGSKLLTVGTQPQELTGALERFIQKVQR